MNPVLSALDAVLCALVLIAALEYLRRIHPMSQPMLAFSFYLVAIAAFGTLVSLMRGGTPGAFEMVMHGGVVCYAWARRHYIFEIVWDGNERRASIKRENPHHPR